MAKIDDSVKKKVPELRFKGFTDDWEERKLGQYTKLITKGTTPKDKTGIGDVNFVKVENITNGKIYPINKIKQNEHDNYLKRSRLEEKDILFSIAGTLGRTAIVNKSILPANTNQALAIIRGYDFDTNFLITSLAGNVVKEYIRRNPTVGAQPNLSLEQVGDLLVNTPNAEEQQKIGSFFKQLDDTIALHQRKLDLLKEQKKGFLQKMFPKNGAKVPELRFAGFADDWEERKLGELSQDTFGGGTPKTSVTEYWNGEIPWIQSSDLSSDHLFGVLPKKHITENAVKNSATKLIPKNSIAIVTRVGVGKLAFMPYEFTSSQDFLSLSNLQVDCNFGMYSIYKMLQRELNNIQGTSIKGITKADLLDKEVIIPVEFEEQKKIGSFFKQLDDTITLHQRKLDLLKEQKKGFLQKMFV